MTNIGFTQQGDRWISDVITATASNMVIRVEFAGNPDICIIERSITGDGWKVAGTTPCDKVHEANVFGQVQGQQFRVITREQPATIGYLE
jgi:hypothetical protein